MLNDYQSIDTLIEGVKGTSSILSVLFSRKTGLFLSLIILCVLLSKLFLG